MKQNIFLDINENIALNMPLRIGYSVSWVLKPGLTFVLEKTQFSNFCSREISVLKLVFSRNLFREITILKIFFSRKKQNFEKSQF